MLRTLIHQSRKRSDLILDADLGRTRPSRLRVDVGRKLMTVSSVNNRSPVTRILNPNGNYLTLSSEIVKFLRSPDKARIAERFQRLVAYLAPTFGRIKQKQVPLT